MMVAESKVVVETEVDRLKKFLEAEWSRLNDWLDVEEEGGVKNVTFRHE